jgi:signal transduction histidine kinase
MSIRMSFALLLLVTLAVAAGFNFFLDKLLESRILSVLPPTLGADTAGAIHLLVVGQFIGVILFCFVLMFLFFWIFGSLIAKPLHSIMKVMSQYATDGTLLPLPKLTSAPKEIRSLAETFADLTSRVEQAHKKDTDISRVKSDFISTAAHQLRTPLTGIRWALEALQQENLTEDQKALVKNATDKSHDLVAIVGTLLDISSIESGKYKYKFEMIDVGEIVSAVAKDFAPLAQKSNITLFYAKESGALPKVKADPDRIKWVLNNLVENAIRYTPAPGTVRISTELNAGRVFVYVKDSGIGIQDKDRGNIFERFYRAGNAITKENQGNGLGLYIARTIATDHGGDLNFVANKEGPGTTFVLTLPVV